MSIPIEVLQKWAKPGKNEMSKQTYNVLRGLLLERLDVPSSSIYLQGSYRNSTNVKDNSDIDIVVEFDHKMGVASVKQLLFNKINNAHNFQFSLGSKTVKYKGFKDQYVPADIVPCVSVLGNADCVKLYDSSRDMIIDNYPKIHTRKGKEKSGRTNGNYKKAVRIMKNARNYLEERNVRANISSYVIECMVYNVPDSELSGNELEISYNVLHWFLSNEKKFSLMSTQDEKRYLFTGSKVSVRDAIQFIDNVVDLWDNWDKY